MPRIVVAVVVFALIVFSIGFNTARYSVVWEMVGESPRRFQPGQASHSGAAAQPSASITRVVSVPAADVRQAAPGHSDLGRHIRRLPPIDRVAPFTADRHAAGGPEDATPIYPSSGI